MNSAQTYPAATVPPSESAASLGRRMLNKVPEITLYFWIIKILCTTVGETAADNLNENLGLGLSGTSYVTGALLIGVLVFQFRARRYVPGIYWAAVVLLSIVGTLITDNLAEKGVALMTTNIIFATALVVTFTTWYVSERTLSVHTGHLGWRLPLRAARIRLPGRSGRLRRSYCRDRSSAFRPADERDPVLLARLHPHPAVGRLDR